MDELFKTSLKQDVRRLTKCMDFVSEKLNKKSKWTEKEEMFFDIYQFLGLAWEALGRQCKHWDGYTKKGFCKICGEVRKRGKAKNENSSRNQKETKN